MLFSAWGKMEVVASQESQDPGSLLPPAPSARRGFVAADTCGQSSSAGRGERKWIQLRVSPGYLRGLSRLRANKEEPWADAAGHPSPSEPPSKMRSGADSASKEGHPGQRDGRGWALLSTGGKQLAVGSPSLGCGCVPGPRASEVFSSCQLAAGGGSASLRQLIMLLLCAGWVDGGRADQKAQPPARIGALHWLRGEHFQEPHQGQKRK